MKYKRLDTCAICGKEVIYDTDTETLTCDCGTIEAKISIKTFREMFIKA